MMIHDSENDFSVDHRPIAYSIGQLLRLMA